MSLKQLICIFAHTIYSYISDWNLQRRIWGLGVTLNVQVHIKCIINIINKCKHFEICGRTYLVQGNYVQGTQHLTLAVNVIWIFNI